MKKIKKKDLKKINNIIAYTLISIIFITMIFGLYFKPNKEGNIKSLMGYKMIIEKSNSMNDYIKQGDLIIIKKANPEKLKEQDIISYRDENNALITHRIIGININNEKLEFTTKGDSNKTADLIRINEEKIEGKLCLKIRGFGLVFNFMQKASGIIISILIILVIFIIKYLINERIKVKKEKNKINVDK